MSKRVKKIYKCNECETMITIITKVHELPESIICPCDSVAENHGEKLKSQTTRYLSIRLREQTKIKKGYRLSHIFQSLNAHRKKLEKNFFLVCYAQHLNKIGVSRGRLR